MADVLWHYSIRGSQAGPISAAELKGLAENGTLSPTDLIWKEGLQTWVAASNVKGLFPPRSGPPPLPSVEENQRGSRPAAADPWQATLRAAANTGWHIQRIAVGALALVGSLTTFMPWVTLPVVGTIYGTKGDGWITLLLFLPAIALVFIGDKALPLRGTRAYAAAVPAGVAAAIGIHKIIDFNSRMSAAAAEAADNPLAEVMLAAMTNTTQIGIGIYLLIATGLAVVAAVFLLPRLRETR